MKRKNILKFSAISCRVSAILLLALLFSCKKMPFTNGNMIIETRQLSDFNAIHINDNININMIKSDSSFIEIRAGENLMPNIISEVVDDILIIKNENIGNLFRDKNNSISADIYYKSNINNIYYHSIGDLHSEDYINDDSLSCFNFELNDGSGDIDIKVKCSRFNLEVYGGSSSLNVNGRCDTIDIYRKGLGIIHLENMHTKVADIMLFSGNDIYVNCSDSLYARIYDFGNIYYKGQPKIKSYISPDALGRIISIKN